MREIQLTQGRVTLVDDDDYELVSRYTWYAYNQRGSKIWYARTNIKVDNIYTGLAMHSLIMGRRDGFIIDHKDRDGLNNQRSNLRFATCGQNQQNRGMRKDNRSGYKGVVFHIGKWDAEIRISGKTIYLGRFTNAQDAARCYNDAAIKAFGEFARINEIPLPY